MEDDSPPIHLTEKRGPGRPRAIDQEELVDRRNRIFRVVQNDWRRTRPRLKSLKSPEQVPQAIEGWKEHEFGNQDLFKLFFRELHYEEFVTQLVAPHDPKSLSIVDLVQVARRHRSATIRQIAHNIKGTTDHSEALSEVNKALEASLSRRQRRILTTEKANLKNAVKSDHQKLVELENDKADTETFLVHAALVQFCTSRRALKPLNVASALAAVPKTSWRRSIAKCAALDPPLGVATTEIVKVVQRIIGSCGSGNDLVEWAETSLRKQRPSKSTAIPHLSENWFFLKKAIRTMQKSKTAKAEGLQYAVSSEYCRLIENPSAADRWFAKKERITRRKKKGSKIAKIDS